MLKKILCVMSLISLVVCTVIALSGSAIAQMQEGAEYVPGELLVKFKADVNKEAAVLLKSEFGLEAIKVLKRTGIHHLKIRSNLTVREMIERLRRSPLVEYAEPNYIRYLGRTPNDSDYSLLWGLDNTGQSTATNLSANPKTLRVTTFAIHPDGTESSLVGPITITLSGNESISHSFDYTVPSSVPSKYFGINRLTGRAWTSDFEDLDEDEELYNLIP